MRLDPDNTTFHGIPSVLISVEKFNRLTSVIVASKCCVGNPDEKFAALRSRHELGVFRDRSGKLQFE